MQGTISGAPAAHHLSAASRGQSTLHGVVFEILCSDR